MSDLSSPDYLTAMEALRDAIVADLEVCESMRDRAALYVRLESAQRLIKDARPKEAEGDGIDEIAARRAARRTSPAKGSGRAKQSG